MIEMSMWFYWFSLAAVMVASGFFCYWMGVNKAESRSVRCSFDDNERTASRLREVSVENHRLRQRVATLEMEINDIYMPPTSTWNNVPTVPGQPRQ